MAVDLASIGTGLLKLIGADPLALLDKAAATVDRFVQSPDEKSAIEQAFVELRHAEQMAQFKREEDAAQIAHNEKMAAYADTASARQIRGIGEYVQAGLAFLFTVAFFTLIVFIMFLMKDVGMTPEQTNIVFLVFGAVSGIMVTVVGFYFGSSAGSKGKDDIIKNLQSVGKE